MGEDEGQLDTSTETTTVETGDQGGGGEVDSGNEQQPAKPADWRVDKYGDDYENSLEYHRDTTRYLRGELDKAKKAGRPQRGIEDHDAQPQRRESQNGNGADKIDPYADVKTVGDVFSRVENLLSERERNSSFRQSMRQAREREAGDPDNGIPGFGELEEEILIPLVQKNPTVLKLLKELDDPGTAAYTLAFVMKFNSIPKLRELFAGKARQDMGDKINEVSRQAVRIKGGRAGNVSAKLSAEEIANMPSGEFEKLVQKNTGRR